MRRIRLYLSILVAAATILTFVVALFSPLIISMMTGNWWFLLLFLVSEFYSILILGIGIKLSEIIFDVQDK